MIRRSKPLEAETPIRPQKKAAAFSSNTKQGESRKFSNESLEQLLPKKSLQTVKSSTITPLKIKPRHHNFRSTETDYNIRYQKMMGSSSDRAYTPLQQMIDGNYDNLPIPQPDSSLNKAKQAECLYKFHEDQRSKEHLQKLKHEELLASYLKR